MEELRVCVLCLARLDLIRITEEKEEFINFLLQRKLPKNSLYCINCAYMLKSFDKFVKNSKDVQNILEQQNVSQNENCFMDVPSTNQAKINSSFDNISEWLADVGRLVRQIAKESGDTATKKKVKQERDVMVIESSSDESEDPTVYDQKAVQKMPKQMKRSVENDVDDLMQYRTKSRKPGNGQYEYKCPICKKVFVRIHLKYHLNLHKGVNPFKCIVQGCSEAFYSPYVGVRHAVRVHNLKTTSKDWTIKERKSPVPSTSKASMI